MKNPLSAALDVQRTALETATETLDRSEVLPERAATMSDIEVGQTPSEVIYEENKLELLHYEPLVDEDEQEDVPILIIYALINKPFILDLQPDRSVVRRLLEAGHDVYLIDWNEPSRLDQHLALDDYVNRYIENCVDVVRERSGQDAINILGYCMGGTMSSMYAAFNPEKVNTLGLMAAGLCFDRTGGILELWGDTDYYDPEDVTEVFGNVPAEMLAVGFALMDPVDNYVSKYVRLYENIENEDFVENFARMERWLNEGIDVAGEAYNQFLADIYQENKLYKNELYIGGEHVDITNIDMPVLQIIGEHDHLIPADASKPFNEVIGSDDVTTIEYPTGHIGLSVSSSSHEEVWPQVCEWYSERSRVEADEPEAESDPQARIEDIAETAEAEIEREADPGAVDEATEEQTYGATEEVEEPADAEPEVEESDPDRSGADAADVETVNGIGPTYAERLRAVDIETVDDLAAADLSTVAEAAEVSESRAQDWFDQIA